MTVHWLLWACLCMSELWQMLYSVEFYSVDNSMFLFWMSLPRPLLYHLLRMLDALLLDSHANILHLYAVKFLNRYEKFEHANMAGFDILSDRFVVRCGLLSWFFHHRGATLMSSLLSMTLFRSGHWMIRSIQLLRKFWLHGQQGHTEFASSTARNFWGVAAPLPALGRFLSTGYVSLSYAFFFAGGMFSTWLKCHRFSACLHRPSTRSKSRPLASFPLRHLFLALFPRECHQMAGWQCFPHIDIVHVSWYEPCISPVWILSKLCTTCVTRLQRTQRLGGLYLLYEILSCRCCSHRKTFQLGVAGHRTMSWSRCTSRGHAEFGRGSIYMLHTPGN